MIATRLGSEMLTSREKRDRTRSLSSKKSGGLIRCGVARRSMPSMPAARQLVLHGHILVNGRKVDIPSFRSKAGDVVTVKEKSRQLPMVLDGIRLAENRTQPSFIDVDRKKLQGTLLHLPERSDIQVPVEEQLVVELYSK